MLELSVEWNLTLPAALAVERLIIFPESWKKKSVFLNDLSR